MNNLLRRDEWLGESDIKRTSRVNVTIAAGGKERKRKKEEDAHAGGECVEQTERVTL